MIVLDEHLQGLGLEDAISRWYRGAVLVVKQLRPGTIIDDEEIPALLRRVKHPTFVTLNYDDFWQRVPADNLYCIVCLKLTTEQVDEVPTWLRQLFRLPEFKTKNNRMGTVILATRRGLRFYRTHEKQVHILSWRI